MWLLDANVDVHLAPILKQQGVACDTVAHRGWKALSNGDLVAAAYAGGFRCLLTRDQLFGESASRALSSVAEFGVVVITLSQQRWPEYRSSSLEAWSASPIHPVPGRLVYWPYPPKLI